MKSLLADPIGESSPQQERIKRIAGMIQDVLAAVKKRQEQLGPYGSDIPISLDGQDLGEFCHDREERKTNGGPESDTPNLTQQGDRTRSFKPGTQIRTRDRYKVRGIGVVLSSKDGMVLVSWGDGDEEMYNAWELIACKPPFGDDEMADTGL